jgi:hypothetical protein
MALKPNTSPSSSNPEEDADREMTRGMNIIERRNFLTDRIAEERTEFVASEADDEEPPAANDNEPPPEGEDPAAAAGEGDDPGDGAGEGDDPGEGEPEAQQTQQTQQQQPPAEPGDDQVVTVLVDGQPMQMRLGDVKRGYQIEQTARQRLEYANQVLEQAKRGAANQSTAPEGGEQQQTGAGGKDVDYVELVRALQYEDPEQGAQAVKDLVEKLQGSGPNMDEVVAAAVAASQNKTDWDNAVARFGKEFPDILKHPEIARIAGQEIYGAVQQAMFAAQTQGRAWTGYWPYFEAVGERYKEKFRPIFQSSGDGDSGQDNPKPKDDPSLNIDASARQGRKVQSQAAARTRTRQSSPVPRTQAPDNEQARASAAIREMQKARGQLRDEDAA